MARKRVHEIAKAQGVTSKEVLAALNAAGVEAKAAASSVEEDVALKALQAAKPAKAEAAPAKAPEGEAKAAAPKAAASGKRMRRVVIDSQASRRERMSAPP